MSKHEDKITEEYLMTVEGETELAIVEGILRAEDIPFVKRYPYVGDGTATFYKFVHNGIELYVSSADLTRARDAVAQNAAADAGDEEQP